MPKTVDNGLILGINCVQSWAQADDKAVYGHPHHPQAWVQKLIAAQNHPHCPQPNSANNPSLTHYLYTDGINKLSGVETEISPPSTGLINTIITLYNKTRRIA